MTKKNRNQENPIQLILDIIHEMPLVPGESSLIAIVQYGSKKKRVAIDSEGFREVLTSIHFKRYGDAPSDKDIFNAIRIVKVEWEGAQSFPLSYRINDLDDMILLDLYNDELQYVTVDKSGWKVRRNGYEYFLTNDTQKQQAEPIKCSGGLSRLDKYLNLSADLKFLWKVTLIASLYPKILVPMVYFVGGKGTGKSSMLQMYGDLLDPNQLQMQSLRAMTDKDLVLSLNKGFFMSFDNISSVSQPASDMLCKAVTKGTQAYRKLYTNGETCSYDIQCRVGISSIVDCIASDDLAQRTLFFQAKEIEPSRRKDEVSFWEDFQRDKPYIFGSMLSVLSKALKIYAYARKELQGMKHHRLASFDDFGFAVATVLQPKGGGERFMDILDKNEYAQLRVNDEEKILVQAMTDIVKSEGVYAYKTRELYDELYVFIHDCADADYEGYELCSYDAFCKKLNRLQECFLSFGVRMNRTRKQPENVSYLEFEVEDAGDEVV